VGSEENALQDEGLGRKKTEAFVFWWGCERGKFIDMLERE